MDEKGEGSEGEGETVYMYVYVCGRACERVELYGRGENEKDEGKRGGETG